MLAKKLASSLHLLAKTNTREYEWCSFLMVNVYLNLNKFDNVKITYCYHLRVRLTGIWLSISTIKHTCFILKRYLIVFRTLFFSVPNVQTTILQPTVHHASNPHTTVNQLTKLPSTVQTATEQPILMTTSIESLGELH